MLALSRLPLDQVDWARLDALPDRVVFQTPAWLAFLADSQAAEPVVAVLHDGGVERGWFTGLLTRYVGVRVLGAPMPGWSTQYLGWNLLPGTTRAQAWPTLLPFAFGPLRCLHVEACDRWTGPGDLRALPGRQEGVRTFVVDLSGGPEAVRAAMTPGTRQNIRKAQRVGVVVEHAAAEGFAQDYYAQLVDVFAKQGLVPTYAERRVQQLVDRLHPTGDLQLLRARDPDGRSIATAIVVGRGATACFWGGASLRTSQHLRPNELLLEHALSSAAQRGAAQFDFGGGGEYKRKYGARELFVPGLRASCSSLLGYARDAAKRAVGVRQQVGYRLSATVRR